MTSLPARKEHSLYSRVLAEEKELKQGKEMVMGKQEKALLRVAATFRLWGLHSVAFQLDEKESRERLVPHVLKGVMDGCYYTNRRVKAKPFLILLYSN